MKRIRFKFRDSMSHGNWVNRECTVSSLEECIRIYGLDEADVEWVLINMEDIE